MPSDNIETRVAIIEQSLIEMKASFESRIGRILSDIESEKGTRSRLSDRWGNDFSRLELRIASLEKHVWVGVGIIAAMQFIVPVILSFLRK